MSVPNKQHATAATEKQENALASMYVVSHSSELKGLFRSIHLFTTRFYSLLRVDAWNKSTLTHIVECPGPKPAEEPAQ